MFSDATHRSRKERSPARFAKRTAFAIGLAALTSAPPQGAAAQDAATSTQPATTLAELTATPEAATTLFLRSVRAIRWSAAAQFMDAETLERFTTTVRMIAAVDTEGDVTRFLVQADSTAIASLGPAEVFARSIGAMIDGMPGLMHSLYDRDDEVLGHVPDGPTTALVVYRTTARLSGAVPEVKVMRVVRADTGGWRVAWSDELEVLEAALRGVGR